jgi:hypothetical protein
MIFDKNKIKLLSECNTIDAYTTKIRYGGYQYQ